jgi:hypothetical protein
LINFAAENPDMKNILISSIFIFVVILPLNAQNSNKEDILKSIQEEDYNKGKVTVFLDEGIEENYTRHLLSNVNQPEVLGYRIRIFSGSGHNAKQRGLTVRATFNAKYPDVGADLEFDYPNYKVYVGNCRTRAEVIKLFEQVERDFPEYNPFITPLIKIDLKKYKSSINNE